MVWYENGLWFSCVKCGACCRDRGGEKYVFLLEGEDEKLASMLRISVDDMRAKYLVPVGGYACLRNKGEDCVFLSGSECIVYPARPLQCSSWPFWPENMRRKRWIAEVEGKCPGAVKGRLFSREEIEGILERQRGKDMAGF